MCIQSSLDNNSYTHLTVSTLNTRCIANKSALFADYVYQCNVDFFVKTETLLSDNDPVICNAIASSGFKLYLIVPRVLVKVGVRFFCLFFNSFMGYDSYNTSTTIKYTLKIENTRYSKNIHWERKADKKSRGHNRTGANGIQGPMQGTAREMKKETKSWTLRSVTPLWHLNWKTRSFDN